MSTNKTNKKNTCMKNFFFLLVLAAGMASSTFAISTDTIRYIIIYGMGIDTLVQKSGDNIGRNSLVFYEKGDQFSRGETVNGSIALSSHGFTFWVKADDFRATEDTIEGSVTITSATLTEDPNTLLATVVKPTSGDEDPLDSSDSFITAWFWLLSLAWYYYALVSLILLCGGYGIFRLWK